MELHTLSGCIICELCLTALFFFKKKNNRSAHESAAGAGLSGECFTAPQCLEKWPSFKKLKFPWIISLMGQMNTSTTISDVQTFHYNNEIKQYILIVAPTRENPLSVCHPSSAEQKWAGREWQNPSHTLQVIFMGSYLGNFQMHFTICKLLTHGPQSWKPNMITWGQHIVTWKFY